MKNVSVRMITVLVLTLILALAGGQILAATKKAPVKKPVQRTVLGTTQLKGDQAKLGVTYTLGKTAPINVTLNSVEYTVEPVMLAGSPVLTNANEKLMVLHYTLHNPNKTDFGLAWSTLNINAVDAKDTNWRYVSNIGMEDTKERCHMSLKPAQKTKVYAVIKVPAKGEIPKVIFEGRDRLVLRYDLRGKVKGIPAPIADPNDPSGATALETVPAQLGTYYPIRELYCKIDSMEFSSAPIKGKAPKKGERYFVVTGSAKNTLPVEKSFVWSTFKPGLTDADGGDVRWSDDGILFASRDETIKAKLEQGDEVRFRFVFRVPEGVGLKAFTIQQSNDSRVCEYDASQVQ